MAVEEGDGVVSVLTGTGDVSICPIFVRNLEVSFDLNEDIPFTVEDFESCVQKWLGRPYTLHAAWGWMKYIGAEFNTEGELLYSKETDTLHTYSPNSPNKYEGTVPGEEVLYRLTVILS